jgi:hypothetical protein
VDGTNRSSFIIRITPSVWVIRPPLAVIIRRNARVVARQPQLWESEVSLIRNIFIDIAPGNGSRR